MESEVLIGRKKKNSCHFQEQKMDKVEVQLSVIFLKNIFIYFWLCWVFTAAHGLFLVAASGGYSLVTVHWLLIVVVFLVAEYGL